ncbi:hypothetical protein D3C76_1591660 [compost metagenome]
MAITSTASAFPTTFSAVRAMSRIRSTPAINARPSSGIPTLPSVASSTTKETPGTPAIPFDVTISVSTSTISCHRDRSIPYNWAMKIAAILWYSVEPSRLKEYPVGTTKLVIDFGAP